MDLCTQRNYFLQEKKSFRRALKIGTRQLAESEMIAASYDNKQTKRRWRLKNSKKNCCEVTILHSKCRRSKVDKEEIAQ
jgi:hypothetical protein